jgi:hypothetical protein
VSELTHTRAPVALPRRAGGDTALRWSVYALLGGLGVLQLWAGAVDYALRVTADTPTFIALVRGLGDRPFAQQSPYLDADVATQHATPYTQLLGFLWRYLEGRAVAPTEMVRVLTLVGIVAFAVTLLCVFRYARAVAGSRAAWLSIPVLLALFGPAHVVWASDLTLHGALYAGFYPQNVALALMLATLLAVRRARPLSLLLAVLGAAATLTVHPFTGLLLVALVAAQSVVHARRQELVYVAGPIVTMLGFLLGLLWPAYSLDRAMGEVGVPGAVFVSLCAAAPLAARYLRLRFLDVLPRAAAALDRPRVELALAAAGAVGFAALCAWQQLLIEHADTLATPRLAIYWVEDRWRWPLMLAAGTVGILGLLRLARRGNMVLPAWFAGCAAVGIAGAAGLPLPLWYRFVLLCQVPLAIGAALVVAETRSLATRGLVGAGVVAALVVKVGTLVALPQSVTYFGSQLQDVWKLGEVLPPGPGLVASDPQTSYYIPAATGHKTLTVSQGHVSSRYERQVAERGYQLLRRFYAGGDDWWQAGQEMWRAGVRYVVIEKNTTLDPRTLADFTWMNARLDSPGERERLGRWFYANNKAGVLLYDSPQFVVYRLDEAKLFGPEDAAAR